MRHVLLAALLVLIPAVASIVAAEPACTFKLGFQLLRDQIPAAVGDCIENEHGNIRVDGSLVNLDTLQRTTGGLLVWRQADNWTAFTDGATTWINGPTGLASRPNAGPLFSWEASTPASAPALGPTTPLPPVPSPTPLLPPAPAGRGTVPARGPGDAGWLRAHARRGVRQRLLR